MARPRAPDGGIGRIPKDILYGELASGYLHVCKRDMKALDINTESLEDAAADGNKWRCVALISHNRSGPWGKMTCSRKAKNP